MFMRCASIAILALVVPAWADPTDIVDVPTAAVLEPRAFEIGIVQDVYDGRDEGIATTVTTLFGITDRIEAGVDFNRILDDVVVEGDIKIQLLDPDRGPFGLAAGAADVGVPGDKLFYGVATTVIGPWGLTAGYGVQESSGLLFGATYAVSPRVVAFAEWFGVDEVASVGGSYHLTGNVAAQARWRYFAETQDSAAQLFLSYAAPLPW